MASSAYPQLSWEDDHTYYLTQLYTLYSRNISWGEQLCDIGYFGYPDPAYEGDNGTSFRPDLLAYSPEGDVQHIEVCTFSKIIDRYKKEEDIIEGIRQELSGLSRYEDIGQEMVSDYLSIRNIDFSPQIQEIVALIPTEIYQNYSEPIDSIVEEESFFLWLIDSNGTCEIWRERGNHANIELNKYLDRKLEGYPGGDGLLHFTRRTDRDLLKFEFTQRLLKHCVREGNRTFSFDQVDDIMTQMEPPLLGHLPELERTDRYWRDFLHSLLNTYELIEQTGQSKYQWKKQRFLKEPRYRKKILEQLQEELGVGEHNDS